MSLQVEPPELLENYVQDMEHRANAYNTSRTSSAVDADYERERDGRSSTIYSKSSVGFFTFEDF